MATLSCPPKVLSETARGRDVFALCGDARCRVGIITVVGVCFLSLSGDLVLQKYGVKQHEGVTSLHFVVTHGVELVLLPFFPIFFDGAASLLPFSVLGYWKLSVLRWCSIPFAPFCPNVLGFRKLSLLRRRSINFAPFCPSVLGFRKLSVLHGAALILLPSVPTS